LLILFVPLWERSSVVFSCQKCFQRRLNEIGRARNRIPRLRRLERYPPTVSQRGTKLARPEVCCTMADQSCSLRLLRGPAETAMSRESQAVTLMSLTCRYRTTRSLPCELLRGAVSVRLESEFETAATFVCHVDVCSSPLQLKVNVFQN